MVELRNSGKGLPAPMADVAGLLIAAAGISAGNRVLGLGSGIGQAARTIATRTGASVVEVDLDGGDAFPASPFEPGGFDAVCQIPHGCHPPDLDRWAESCARVLKPHGRLVAVDRLAGERLDDHGRILNDVVRRSLSLPRLHSLTDIAKALRSAGLTVLQAQDLTAQWFAIGDRADHPAEPGSAEPGSAEPGSAEPGSAERRAAIDARSLVVAMITAEKQPPRRRPPVTRTTAAEVGILPGSRWRAQTRLPPEAREPALGHVIGAATAGGRDLAETRATMEGLERQVQFAVWDPPQQVQARRSELREAIDPRCLGLYSPLQYATPGFPARPYDEGTAYRWAGVVDLRSGQRRLVPVEFLHPALVSAPLVRETSTGTAAHRTFEQAAAHAIAEVVERDALLRWWYHGERAHPVRLAGAQWADVREDLDALGALGFVAVLVRPQAVAGFCVHAAVAIRGDTCVLAGAAATDDATSIRRAVRELGQLLGDRLGTDHSPAVTRPDLVQAPGDHQVLYQRPPYSGVIRAFLAATLGEPVDAGATAAQPGLDAQVASLAAAGCSVYAASLGAGDPPRSLWIDGVPAQVVRVLIPELIPFHLGHNRERFGHPRLASPSGGRRLRTLLPHPFG